MKKSIPANSRLCNIKEGICKGPERNFPRFNSSVKKPIHLLYFTDPICSSCLTIEPQLRKLKLEYGHLLYIEYCMGGMLPSWDTYRGKRVRNPASAARHWEEIGPLHEIPIDGDVWIKDPLRSSYPPCIAFKAAQMQDKEKALLFLRRIKEMVFFERKNITRWPHLKKAAKDVQLNPIQLKIDYLGRARALFEADLELARHLNVYGFPTLFFTNTFNQQAMLYGCHPYGDIETILLRLLPGAIKKTINPSWENLFSLYPGFTTKEFSVLSGQRMQEAELLLDSLQAQNKIRKIVLKNGAIWRRKNIVYPGNKGLAIIK